jgi:hypothetical protein
MSSIFIGICKPFRGFLARVPLAVAGAILALAGTAGAQQVYFDPSANYPNDYVFTVELHIATGGQAVQGVEARIVYDNFLLHLDAVTPGPWLTGASLRRCSGEPATRTGCWRTAISRPTTSAPRR